MATKDQYLSISDYWVIQPNNANTIVVHLHFFIFRLFIF